ncbi:BQ5605_C007g04838 [Microbotryum silenes-dioicae]|uniref:BQ5605_C007g04838 protein n=1 Tax=Microbotryum silenes-dioicae TaxID=796604 RepID=A0A2X0P3P1_9BASI|nr:BQ5605_C007g04838 [Microbotryum silenes-dioicae]
MCSATTASTRAPATRGNSGLAPIRDRSTPGDTLGGGCSSGASEVVNVPPGTGTSGPLDAIIPRPVARFAMEQRFPCPLLPQHPTLYELLNMSRRYTIRRIRRPDDLKGFWKGVNSNALTAREEGGGGGWFKVIRRCTPNVSIGSCNTMSPLQSYLRSAGGQSTTTSLTASTRRMYG